MVKLIKSIVLTSIIFILGCKNPSESTGDPNLPESDFTAKISSKAGDFLDPEIFDPLPTFFNVADMSNKKGESCETIILSKQLNKGQLVKVKPVGLLRFKMKDSPKNYIISVPVDSTLSSQDISSYHDFSQKNYHTKFLLEDWFRSNCKVGTCSNFSWHSEIQALKQLRKSVDE